VNAWYESRGTVIATALAGIAVAGFLVWFLVFRDERTAVNPDAVPVEASEADLKALSGSVGHPVYWIGDQEGTQIELTRLSDDQVYLRYLDEDAEVGDPGASYLSVGTYPVTDAYATLQAVAELEGSVAEELNDGALVVQSDEAPESVYMAYPDQDLQIEVYDSNPKRALRIATSGAVQPAG
jgi:hypothetical protein